MKKWNLSCREKGILVFAAGLILLAVVFCSVSGMVFLGYLAIEGAAVCVAWIWLCRWAKKSKVGNACKVIFLVVLVSGILLFAIAEGIVVSYGERDPDDIAVDAVIVLGAGINHEEPSPTLRTRLNAAKSFMERYPDIPVILSGGLGLGETVTEAEVMKKALSNGDPDWDARLLPEGRATSTAENFRYSCAILEEIGIEPEHSTIAVVTNDFHIYRAKLIAERMGLEVVGVPAELPWWWVNLACYVREAFALVKTVIFD